MTDANSGPLLGAGDPPPVNRYNPEGRSPFLLIGDHAGNLVPRALNALGVGEEDRSRHIGWDIGVAGLGRMLADAIDAVFIHQSYSRLVIDCNRRPGAPDAVPCVSDRTIVPGNADLAEEALATRRAEIQQPYQDAIAAELARRQALVSLHSFTPAMDGKARPWHVGILHDRGDTRLAQAMLAALRSEDDLCVGDNEPYRMDNIDYTVPLHVYPAGIPYAEIEIRQDLIADAAGQQSWADRLARILTDLPQDLVSPAGPMPKRLA